MLFNSNDKLNTMLNTALEDGYDNVGIFVKNIKLKAINFSKKSQKKINQYLIEHKKFFKSSSIVNANWKVEANNASPVVRTSNTNAMQNQQYTPNLNTFKICSRCGFKNNSNAASCRNCCTRF